MQNQLTLSKSDFQRYLEAPLHLWACKHNSIQTQPSEFDLHLMQQGYQVEDLAREYLYKHILSPDSEKNLQFQQTFSDGPFTARTDALVHKPQSETFDLYEIKSSTACKSEHIIDAAFQALIVRQHRTLDRIFILYLNKDYVRQGALDLKALFRTEDVTEKVHQIIPEIASQRTDALAVAQQNTPDGIPHCYKPKDCPCPDLCHPSLPQQSIYDIPRLLEKKKIQLLGQGICAIKDIPHDFPLNAKQRKIVQIAQSGQPFVDTAAISHEFDAFQYPLYFLDYETYISAIPLFNGYHPQQQMVFQYSLHKMDALNTYPTHSEFLSLIQDEPSRSLVEKLVKDIGDAGTVFVWNKTFEIGRNKELSLLYPAYAAFFERLNMRIYDLGDFVDRGLYIHPDFKGSWSIKNVLPVMVPDLTYQGMPIGDGGEAMAAWGQLKSGKLSPAEFDQIKKDLLSYCELDTLAMVRIFKTLAAFLAYTFTNALAHILKFI